ncbi:unnamed protein product, partial [Wuchereria bancrofti]
PPPPPPPPPPPQPSCPCPQLCLPCPPPLPPLPPLTLPCLPCPCLPCPCMPMPTGLNSCCNTCNRPCSFRSRRRRSLNARALARGMQNLNDDPVCNNAELRSIIKQNLVDDIWLTKEMIQKAVTEKYPSIRYNIICATGGLTYTAQTHDFCLIQQNNTSCYVFRPL